MSQETLVVVESSAVNNVPVLIVDLFGQRGGKPYGPQRETILDPEVNYADFTVEDIQQALKTPLKAFGRVYNGQRVIDLRSGNNTAAAKTDYVYKSVATARSALASAALNEQHKVVANVLEQFPALASDKQVRTLLEAVGYSTESLNEYVK